MSLRDELVKRYDYSTVELDTILSLVEKHYNERPSGLVAVRECKCPAPLYKPCTYCKGKKIIERDLTVQEAIEIFKMIISDDGMTTVLSARPYWEKGKLILPSGERVEVKK